MLHSSAFWKTGPGKFNQRRYMDAPRTREQLETSLETITDQIQEGIERGKFTLSQLQSAVGDRTRQAVETTDRIVHENPWSAIGVAVGLGVLIGFLLPRR